ncbi:MAG: hypothetical protein LUG18_09620 [Candidatus Azobacteroides sp.]|nr:hypothetical protein [Candidatus Azobacteroides sp.]
MSKIDTLHLHNFKFFDEQPPIKLEGKHWLLFGENGSGKSSISWGLYTLLEASMKTANKTDAYFLPLTASPESLVNIYALQMSCMIAKKAHHNSFIEVTTDNPSKQYKISLLDTAICGDSTAQESRKASDFINYQALFKFQEFRNSDEPNLFEVFNYSVLPYVSFAEFTLRGRKLSNAMEQWNAYKKGPGTTTNAKGDIIQAYKHSADYQNFLNFEKHFISEFNKLIDTINVAAPEMMKKLGYEIEFNLKLISPTHKKRDKIFEHTPYKIEFTITKYNGMAVHITRPHSFLNEAKMTAVAISIRLSILKHRISKAAPDALKVLVLDDTMISLDMSNRDTFITLLLKEFTNDYQILFLTHDKSLYKFVNHKISQLGNKTNWCIQEMYVGEKPTIKQEYPVLIDGEDEPYQKARKYYEAKDYTTSALYIRQTLEKIVAKSLPDEVKRSVEDKFLSLDTLWQKAAEYHKIPDKLKTLFSRSKLMVLNPSAHHQRLSQPIYKRELLDAFELVDGLEKLNLHVETLLIEKAKKLVFTHPTENYSFEFELIADMGIDKQGQKNDPKCKIHTWQYNNIDYYDFNTLSANPSNPYAKSKPRFSRLKQGLLNLPLQITEECFLENTIIENGVLKDALMDTE